MAEIINNPIYIDDLKKIADFDLPWEKLENKTLLIIGATGMIGSCLIDCLMYRYQNLDSNITIIALSRNENRAKLRFSKYWNSPNFKYISHDCLERLPAFIGKIDYAIHAASNTHPVAYSTDPIGTITTNIFGSYNLLEYLKNQKCRILFVSSVEIYGENNTNKISLSENECGFIDCNTMRAGYPESKRVSESLCQAYISKYQMNIVIARLCRVFGPTMLESDSKALSQFIRKAVKGEDIVLKSEGKQFYSYIYVFDAVLALFIILLKGLTG
ncbi:MAG: NAD-dependent epimerase/dehydratase family protein, partial [Candidatus Riflebacteria bacterium]|nr:NAD-dependent epimerase/dehydratase family protein [Candidatus Riflebacteria bacterium]